MFRELMCGQFIMGHPEVMSPLAKCQYLHRMSSQDGKWS